MRVGRVEIIDDEIMFPYPARENKRPRQVSSSSSIKSSLTVRTTLSEEGEPITPNGQPSTPNGQPTISIRPSEEDSNLHAEIKGVESSFLDLDLDGESDRRSIDSSPGLCNDDSPSEESCDNLLTPTDYTSSIVSVSDKDSLSDSASNRLPSMSQCQEVEKVFEDMLEGYGVDTCPSQFLEQLLRKIFGPVGKPRMTNDFQLALLNPVIHELYTLLKNMGFHNKENLKRGKLFKEPKLKR